MLENLTKEIKAQLYERARSPLTGAFSISWIAWNLKPIVVLLSNETLNSKYALWGAYYASNYESFLYGLIYPLISAALYILLYPYPARWAYQYWHSQHKKIKVIQQRIEDETPLTQEEAKVLRATSIQEMTKMQQELGIAATANRELTNRNRELYEQIAELKNKNEQMSNELAQFHSEKVVKNNFLDEIDHIQNGDNSRASQNSAHVLTELQRRLLEQLSILENRGQNWTPEQELLMGVVPRDITGGKIALHELESVNHVTRSTTGKYSLAHSGRVALKKHLANTDANN